MLNTHILLVISFVIALVCSERFVGDICTIKSTGDKGMCRLFRDCKSAADNLRTSKRFPQPCGFAGNEPIVCCPGPQRKPGEISLQKCEQYSAIVNVTSRSPILVIGAPITTRHECGHSVVKLIVGGVAAGRREFPHMAAIGYEPNPGEIGWYCGGTIISERYVLTAAHCLSHYDRGDAKWVKLGVTALNDTSRIRQHIKIVERIPHFKYNVSSHYHDIGLLKLEKDAKMSPDARPACLYLRPDVDAKMAIATGWGQTKSEVGSNDLMKVTIDLFDYEYCNNSYNGKTDRKFKDGIVDDIQLCAGSQSELKDTCQGDSGGPLQIYHIGDKIKCMYDIIGVTSFGKSCTGSAGVYVRVSHYIKWIEDIVWPH